MNATVIRKNSRVTLLIEYPAIRRVSNRAIKVGTRGKVIAVRLDGCMLVKFIGHADPQAINPGEVTL